MGIIDKARELRWRRAGHYRVPLPPAFTAALQGATVLEVGGPSALFRPGGLLPVYPIATRVDGVQFAADTVWHGTQDDGDYRPDDRSGATGHMIVVDGASLDGVPDRAYDAVISSHVIEHFANPLRALGNWRRVTRSGGHLLTVAPHASGTFDRRRPVTPLAHIVADHEAGIGEDDLTHLDETLALHDLGRDPAAGDRETFEAMRRENVVHRVLHHHTFTGPSLVALLDHAGLQVDAVDVRFPHDIYVLGHWAEAPDNAAVLDRRHPAWRASPFAADRALQA